MGFEMAVNLSKSSYELIGYDIIQSKYDTLEKNNIKCVSTIDEALSNPDVIITMLPDGKIVKKVWEKIFSVLKTKPLVIDCSTIDIQTARYFHNLANQNNIKSLDAPVSGGVIGAKNSSLTFMVGGSKHDYDKAKPLFDVMGDKSVLCGAATSGQAVKICNNMLLAVTMVGVSEAFNLATSLNLNQQTLFDVISTSSGSCWAVNNYCPVKAIGPNSPADNEFIAGFASNLMHKDLSLAIAAAKETNTEVNFTKETHKIFTHILENGNGNKDFSFIKEHLK